MMKLSDYVIDFIVNEGVAHVFELTGGMITHLLDSIHGRDDITCVSVHHEQTGAFAAEAYARVNGKLGVAMATSGPGALNLMTGIGSCYFDSVPCLFITGQVNTYECKSDSPVRQIGFQETDIVAIAKPLTKYSEMVVDALKIRFQMEKAVYLAQSGRPGPALLDIPMNIQRAQIEPELLESYFDSEEYQLLQKEMFVQKEKIVLQNNIIIKMLAEAKRPVILAGGGIRTANASDELIEFIDKTGFPFVTSLMGLDAVPHDNPAFFGMIGSYGNRYSNLVLANCDLLVVLGSRLDTRQTGTNISTFARAAKKIQIDIDPIELNRKVIMDVVVNCDVKDFLNNINKMLDNFEKPNIDSWLEKIICYRDQYPTRSRIKTNNGVEPNSFLELLSGFAKTGDVICLDVGQNQMWAAQSFRIKNNQRLLVSGGMGAMGFALPAAIGAVKAKTNTTSIVIAGDGGIQINIQDLEIIARQQLPIKIFVLNNGCLGMVRQFQDLFFDGRRQSTVIGYHCPDLIKIAQAYEISTYEIASMDSATEIINNSLSADGPAFINVVLELNTEVNPKLIFNRPIEDMSPPLERAELKKIMIIDLLEENSAN